MLFEGYIERARKGRIKVVSAETIDEAYQKLGRECKSLEKVVKIRMEERTIFDLENGGWIGRGF